MAGETIVRIVHVIIGLGVGGAELMLKRLIEGLDGKDGMEHSVISLTDLGPVGHQLRDLGVDVKALGMRNVLSIPKTLFRLRVELKNLKPDIVQTWMYLADILGGLAAKSLRVNNIIWNVRNTNFGLNGLSHTILIKVSSVLSKSIPKKIVYVSNSAKDSHELVGYRMEKSIVIYNGFDTENYCYKALEGKSLREEFQFKNSDVVFCSVGRYAVSKDHLTLIKAIKIAIKSNKNIKVLMVGLNVDNSNATLVDAIGNDTSYFCLAGQRNDIPSVFSGVNAFCLHSITEGFPNVLGEAMSSGLPCITTRAGDAELILNNKDYTVNIKDVDDLAEKIINMSLLSLDQRVKLGKRNRVLVLDKYSLNNVFEKYKSLYLRESKK
ncbi:glycosyltransferase [Shewanella sp. T24-MNA-CIBAN-0130]|uniref:glycosyltransferase n=1 Tax=Shewanella sp. T24-MNA-CIBAN-0130 TaxID=3140470 RepID=UPI003322EFFD